MTTSPGFIQSIAISSRRSSVSERLNATTFHVPSRPARYSTRSAPARRCTISANSLEESKRRARSQYDNIPDLNQQYISELGWVERKYGRQRAKKDIAKEAQKSILRPDGPTAPPQRPSIEPTIAKEGDNTEADLSQYNTIRNQLLANTVFAGALGICLAWGFGSLKEVQSFAVGFLGSVAYVYLLSRSVDRMADAARETGLSAGDALQPARVAILVVLVIASAKNSDKLSVLPVLFGFFTYKVGTLIPLLTGEAFE